MFVAEGAPKVPAGHGAEWTPLLGKPLDAATFSVDVCDSAFQSHVAQGKHVGFSEDHDAEY